MQYNGFPGLLELLNIAALDALILHQQNARFGPFSPTAERDRSDHGIEGRLVDVVGKLRIVERADRFDCRFEDLHLGVGVGRKVETDGIDAGCCRTLEIAIQELLDAGKLQGQFRDVEVVGDDAVEKRAELRLQLRKL